MFKDIKGDNTDEEFYSPLPRAVSRPSSYLLLDGVWRFSLDPKDLGLAERWYLGHEYEYQATLPGSIEKHITQTSQEKEPFSWDGNIVAWYEREFSFETEHLSHPYFILQLTFGACGYETQVWLNGALLRTVEGEDVHKGSYTPFSYELSGDSLKSINRLTVRIAASMDGDIPRGNQQSYVYKLGGAWTGTHTGALRSIWIENVERNRFRSRLGVHVIEGNLVRFKLTTNLYDPGLYIIRLKVLHKKSENGEPIIVEDFPVNLPPGQKQQLFELEVPGAEMWSPENPFLYRLVAQLINDKGYTSEIETYFGLRKLESRGHSIYLNNKELYLDGISYFPGASTRDQIEQHMHALKALGCNLVRINGSGFDPLIYKLADCIGLLVWVEVPSPHASNNRSRANHRNELLQMLTNIESYPSVVIWSLYREDIGAQDISTNAEVRHYIFDTYHYIRIYYPQYLVIDNDGWHHISLEDQLKSDLLTIHLPFSTNVKWHEQVDRITSGHLNDVAALPIVVGDAFMYRKQVPLVISNWGESLENSAGSTNEASIADQIRMYKKEFRRRQIAGDIYKQISNIEEEMNGLIDTVTGKLKFPRGLLRSTPEPKTQHFGKFYSCFISYNHQDKVFAHRLYDKLQSSGVKCWLDEHHMLPGDDLYEKISDGIKSSDKVLLCCSKKSLTSWWVDNEIDSAFEKERTLMKKHAKKLTILIPINLDGFLFSDKWQSGKKEQVLARFAVNFKYWKKSNDVFNKGIEKLLAILSLEDTH